MNSGKPKITKVYYKQNPDFKLEFDFDQSHLGRPHWIRIKNQDKLPRFLSVKTPQNSELIYKSFGKFFYPINFFPSQEVQNSLMKAAAENYDQIVGDLNVKIANFIYKKSKKLNLDKNISILDLGAGTGITSTPFLENGFKNLTLVDISPEMKKVALEKDILKSADYVNQDVKRLSLEGKYDLVISGMFLCDLSKEGRNKTFQALKPLLNKGAYIILVEDERRQIYTEYFEEVESGITTFNEYEKFYFVGRKK